MIINFYGAAGSGKSTTAFDICSKLRKLRYNCDYAQEFIKTWAYEGRKCKSFDQLYIFANQIYTIDFLMQVGVNHVITDSPVLMQCVYTKNSSIHNELLSIAKKFHSTYPTIDIFLDRKDIPYETRGRYETYEQALEMDKIMLKFLQNHVDLIVADARDEENILGIILRNLNG